MTRMGPFLLYAAICIGVPQAVSGQIRASERSTVTQTIDGTTITVDYGRVQRNDILGSEVAWGDVWTAGANWATYLEVSEGITLDGHRLRQGKYLVWIDVEADDWTVIFDPSARGCEVIPPPTSPGQVRFAIEPTHGTQYSEFLTWSFPVVRPTGGVLHVSWSTTTVDFEIGVTPSRPFTVDHDLAEQYLGTYSLELGPQLGGGEMEFSIRYEDSRLMASWKNPPNHASARFGCSIWGLACSCQSSWRMTKSSTWWTRSCSSSPRRMARMAAQRSSSSAPPRTMNSGARRRDCRNQGGVSIDHRWSPVGSPYCLIGVTIMCAPWVPGNISHGAPGPLGTVGRPVLPAVAPGR